MEQLKFNLEPPQGFQGTQDEWTENLGIHLSYLIVKMKSETYSLCDAVVLGAPADIALLPAGGAAAYERVVMPNMAAGHLIVLIVPRRPDVRAEIKGNSVNLVIEPNPVAEGRIKIVRPAGGA